MRFSLDSSSVSRFVQFPRSGRQALLATAGLFLAVPLVFGQSRANPGSFREGGFGGLRPDSFVPFSQGSP